MKSTLIVGLFVYASALLCGISEASPLKKPLHGLICPLDIACEFCPPGEVPVLDSRGCWSSSCECKVAKIRDPCSTYVCPKSQRCELNWITKKPRCVNICPSHCSDIYRPVCGSDTNTYNNECELKVRSCLTGGKLKKIADQACCFNDPVTGQRTCIARK